MSKAIKFTKSSDNLFSNMGFSEEEAKELQFRSFLMTVIVRYIKLEGLTQKEAARRFKITQSRVSNLVRGKIDLFRYHDTSIFAAFAKHNNSMTGVHA